MFLDPEDDTPPTVAIPAGCFRMGSAGGRPDESPVHEVEVGAFHLGRTPVTRAQFAPLVESGAVEAPPWWSAPAFSGDDHPVTGVTWFDAVAYTEWLSRRTGGRWRLPTEAEWERAARGGLDAAPTPWGDSLPEGEVPAGLLDGPWRVGRGAPNPYGLLDAGTVVHEWCLDWYVADYYAWSPRRDPRGPVEGEGRIADENPSAIGRVEPRGRRASRGGSWRHRVRWSPPSARSSLPPGFRYADYGFRVLLTP